MVTLPNSAGWSRKLLTLLSYLASGELAAALRGIEEGWEVISRMRDRIGYRGMFEVLDFDASLELLDPRGEQAVLIRHQKIKVLQDNVVAVLDHVWGDGELLAEYDCQPGIPVDFYGDGSIHNVLISLREPRGRGDIIDLWIRRVVRGGFCRPQEWLETEVNYWMQSMRQRIIFPSKRHCRGATISRRWGNRTLPLGKNHFTFMSDGRQQLEWRTSHPKLHDRYTIKWDW